MSTARVSTKQLKGIYKELAAYGKIPKADTVEEMAKNLKRVVREHGFHGKVKRSELFQFASELLGERNWFQEVGNPYDDDESDVEVEPTKRTKLARAELDSLAKDVKFLGYELSGNVSNQNKVINKILEDEGYKGSKNVIAKMNFISNLAREVRQVERLARREQKKRWKEEKAKDKQQKFEELMDAAEKDYEEEREKHEEDLKLQSKKDELKKLLEEAMSEYMSKHLVLRLEIRIYEGKNNYETSRIEEKFIPLTSKAAINRILNQIDSDAIETVEMTGSDPMIDTLPDLRSVEKFSIIEWNADSKTKKIWTKREGHFFPYIYAGKKGNHKYLTQILRYRQIY